MCVCGGVLPLHVYMRGGHGCRLQTCMLHAAVQEEQSPKGGATATTEGGGENRSRGYGRSCPLCPQPPKEHLL